MDCLQAVKEFAADYKLAGLKLHCLVNSAGTALPPRGITENGFEVCLCNCTLSDAWYSLMCYKSCNLVLPALSGELHAISAVQRLSYTVARTLVQICTPWQWACTPEMSSVAVHSIA